MPLYIAAGEAPQIFDPLLGWIGEMRRPLESEAPACRPFVMNDSGGLDFGTEAGSRHGHIHWVRWSRVAVGMTVEVELDDTATDYTVHKIMRL